MKKLSLLMMAFAIALYTASCGSGSSDEKSDDKKEEKKEKTSENDENGSDESCGDEDTKPQKPSGSADEQYVKEAMNALCGCFDELGVSTIDEFANLDGDGQASFDNCMSDLESDYADMDVKVEAIGQAKFMEIVKKLPCSKIAVKMFEE